MTEGLAAYPEYKNSEIGPVPAHWAVRRLKRVCRFAYGDALRSETRQVGTVPVYGSNGRVGLHSSANTRAPCIVIGRKGSFGKVNFSADPVFAIDTTFFVDDRATSVEIRWLFYLLRWLRLDNVSKDSAIPGLDREDAYIRSVPVPTPVEQRAIAQYLDRMEHGIGRYISAKKKLVALLTEQRQAIVQRAATRGFIEGFRLKPSGLAWPREVPAHWEVVPLKRLLDRLIDCEHKTAPMVDDSPYRVVRTTAVRGGRLQLKGTYCTAEEHFRQWTRRGTPQAGDVIFTREAPAGEAFVVPDDLNLCLGQRTVLMQVKKTRVDPQFLVHAIYGGPPSAEVRLASRGSTVAHFNVEDIAAMAVLMPPLIEQKQIIREVAAHTREIDSALDHADRQIDLLREYRGRLIADVVAGQLDVREAPVRLPIEATEGLPELDEVEPLDSLVAASLDDLDTAAEDTTR